MRGDGPHVPGCRAHHRAAAPRGQRDVIGAAVARTDAPFDQSIVDEAVDGAGQPALREEGSLREVRGPHAHLRRTRELNEQVVLAERESEARAGLALESACRGGVREQKGLPGPDLGLGEPPLRLWNRLRSQRVDCSSN